MVRGEGNYKFVQGGIRFLIIRMYNKVLNGQSKPCLQDLLSEQHHAKQLSVSCTFFRMFQIFVARASQAFLWYSQSFSESIFSKLLRHNPIRNRVTRSYFISVYGDSSFRSVLSCSKLHISFFLRKLSTKF